MVYNILNGDSLAYSFPDAKIEGDVIVAREGLIDFMLSIVSRRGRCGIINTHRPLAGDDARPRKNT